VYSGCLERSRHRLQVEAPWDAGGGACAPRSVYFTHFTLEKSALKGRSFTKIGMHPSVKLL
jgi:hypothetical protein